MTSTVDWQQCTTVMFCLRPCGLTNLRQVPRTYLVSSPLPTDSFTSLPPCLNIHDQLPVCACAQSTRCCPARRCVQGLAVEQLPYPAKYQIGTRSLQDQCRSAPPVTRLTLPACVRASGRHVGIYVIPRWRTRLSGCAVCACSVPCSMVALALVISCFGFCTATLSSR